MGSHTTRCGKGFIAARICTFDPSFRKVDTKVILQFDHCRENLIAVFDVADKQFRPIMSLSVHFEVVDGGERSVALVTLSTNKEKKKQRFDSVSK